MITAQVGLILLILSAYFHQPNFQYLYSCDNFSRLMVLTAFVPLI